MNNNHENQIRIIATTMSPVLGKDGPEFIDNSIAAYHTFDNMVNRFLSGGEPTDWIDLINENENAGELKQLIMYTTFCLAALSTGLMSLTYATHVINTISAYHYFLGLNEHKDIPDIDISDLDFNES